MLKFKDLLQKIFALIVSIAIVLGNSTLPSFAERRPCENRRQKAYKSRYNNSKRYNNILVPKSNGFDKIIDSKPIDESNENNKIHIYGGNYKLVSDCNKLLVNKKNQYEVHHLISKAALQKHREYLLRQNRTIENDMVPLLYFQQNYVPSISMEKKDHQKTRSYGNSAFVDEQSIQLRTTSPVDIIFEEKNDIQKKFGNKYDEAIEQAVKYMRGLNLYSPKKPPAPNLPNIPGSPQKSLVPNFFKTPFSTPKVSQSPNATPLDDNKFE